MSLESKIISPKRVILEVGVGRTPFPSVGRKAIQRHELYVGIDLWEKHDFFRFPRSVAKSALDDVAERNEGVIALVQADANSLPLKDLSVDEVVFCNVFGDNPEYLMGYLKEVTRIAKTGSRLVVVETWTPNVCPPKRARNLLKIFGFAPVNTFSNFFNRKKHNEYYSGNKKGSFALEFTKTYR